MELRAMRAGAGRSPLARPVLLPRLRRDAVAHLAAPRGLALELTRELSVSYRTAGVDLGGSVYFLRSSIAPTMCEPRQPLTFRNVLVERLSGAGAFHVKNWTGVGGAATLYDLSVEAGALISSQPGGGIY